MGFFSFLGRLLFASLFILSAWQMFNEFGTDGGPAAKELVPKIDIATKHISSNLGVQLIFDVRYLVATIIFLKGLGGFLFVFGSNFGVCLLMLYLVIASPLLYDFYNYAPKDPEFIALLKEFLQSVGFFGALLFFIQMKNSIRKSTVKKKATPKPKAS